MLIIGHRGAKGLAPENTLAGFKKALDLGVDGIEFDVCVTKDEVPIIHHDRFLKDASGNRLKINDHFYEELKQHKPDLPTLKEALDFINGTVVLFIEIKPKTEVQPVADVLAKYRHSFLIGSKSQSILMEFQTTMPLVPKIVIESWSGIRAAWRARRLKTNRLIMYEYFLWFGFVRAMKKAGYELYVYPMNDPKKAKRWARYGIAGVVTDFPDRFVKP